MLELVVFLCGAVVMVLEMVGSRILAPYLGSSIIVWTSLIGIILASLSIGYWWGGAKADKNASYRGLSLIILLAAFFIAAIALSKSFILDFLQDHATSIRLSSAVATIVLFAPPGILLGMVSPYAVKLKLTSLDKSGNTVGRLYAVSTIGSILGTFAGGFYLIAFLGSTKILYVLSIILVVTSLVAFMGGKLLKLSALGLFVILAIAADSYENYLAAHGFHDIDTDYNRIIIYDGKDFRSGLTLRIMTTHPKAMQSAMYVEEPTRLALPYSRFYDLASCCKPDLKSMLIIGGGGYSYPKHALAKYPNLKIDVMEIDPKVTELAREFFALGQDPRLTVIHGDARSALNKSDKKYDAILIDAFNSHYSIPFHLTTQETALLLHDRLADDGVVILNILASLEGRTGRFLRAEYATYKSVFRQVRLYPVNSGEDGDIWQNIMLVAQKTDMRMEESTQDPELRELLGRLYTGTVREDVPILTDDFAPVDSYIAY